jgi:hypothetical protein
MGRALSVLLTAYLSVGFAQDVSAQYPPGEGPALGPDRIEQSDITGGALSLTDIRKAGLKIFATPFNKLDGYGDGPVDLGSTTVPGNRPTLQGNGTFLRVNGLDSQSCMECHSVGSNAVVPFRFAIGGAGGSNNNAMFMPTVIDVADDAAAGEASFNGRYINTPFVFGSGGVELLAKEMTRGLIRIRRKSTQQPGLVFALNAKGVNFGSISYNSLTQTYDVSNVVGVDTDLVVRPFGRKGDNATARQFDLGALQFHMGMQPEEIVGTNIDADGDGVANEILIGEVSAMHIFDTNLEPPTQDPLTPAGVQGATLFNGIGCASCHIPFLDTVSPLLTYSFPEQHDKPSKNVYYGVDLSQGPTDFDLNQDGGIRVRLFSDLKRHDMGPGLAEDFGSALDAEFITARLWGIADTAPYLHDGRALTLTDAILEHGGDAQAARDAFDDLVPSHRIKLLTFLRSLRTPIDPAIDLL